MRPSRFRDIDIGWIATVFALTLFAFTTCDDEYDYSGTGAGSAGTPDMEQRVHQLVNAYRAEQSLASLTWSEVVAEQCRNHSSNMATGAVAFGHSGFEERGDIIAETIAFSSKAENVAHTGTGDDPAGQAVNMWLGSDDHRRNIEGNYTMTGVGVAVAGNNCYFTQMFINAR